MANWRLAYSLETLRNEVNARWPNRNKASDGTIGNPAHAATASDHNPNADGVVCAFDITNDPNGPTAQYLFDTFVANPHPDAKYFIANSHIASKQYGWIVRPYYGSDPHTSHIHVSVGVGPDGQSRQPYDDRVTWFPAPQTATEDKVLHIVIAEPNSDGGKWWCTDWIQKWWIPSAAAAAQIIVSTRAHGGTIECRPDNGPVAYDAALVNAVPEA